jgi:pilus assembly protein CpaE
MKAVIATNDPSLSAKISAGLRQVGIDCPASQIVSLDSAQAAVNACDNRASIIVFFGSQQFSLPDMSQLRELCAGSGPHGKVVAVGPAHSPHVVLHAIHSGAVDFLDVKGDFDSELRNLVGRLKTAAGDGAKVGRLFTVVGPSGGAGASVLATNLAAVLAQREKVCCLLDLHICGGDLAILLKSRPRHTLLSLAGKAQQLDRAMFDQSLVKHECGIHLLASPELFSDYRQINPQVIQQVIQFARESFPSVVVELEDMEHAEQVRTLAASDRIIIPLRLDFVALNRTKQYIDHLLRASVRRECIMLVACRVGQPNELPIDRFAEVLGMPVEHRIPHEPAAVNAAVNLGMPLVVASPKAKSSMSIVRLAESLIGAERAVGEPNRAKRPLFSLKSAASLLGLVTS